MTLFHMNFKTIFFINQNWKATPDLIVGGTISIYINIINNNYKRFSISIICDEMDFPISPRNF